VGEGGGKQTERKKGGKESGASRKDQQSDSFVEGVED